MADKTLPERTDGLTRPEIRERTQASNGTVENWVRSGILRPVGRRPGPNGAEVFEVADVDVAAARYIAARKVAKERLSDRQESIAALESERIKLTRAKREAAEMANAQKRGQLVLASEVEARWTQVGNALREALLTIPGSAVQAGLIEPRRIGELDAMLRDILSVYGRSRGGKPVPAPEVEEEDDDDE